MTTDEMIEIDQNGYKVMMEQRYDELVYTRRLEKGYCPNIECEGEDLDWELLKENNFSLTYSERFWKVTCPDCGWHRTVVEQIDSTFVDYDSADEEEENEKK